VRVLVSLMLLVVALPRAARAEERHVVVVTAAPPLDAERLADVLRTYLEGYEVEVRARAAAPTADDLRQQITATRAAAEEVRAFAAIRVASTGETVEVQLVDELAKKSLVATIPRSRRDEDLYRTLALKVQLLLRSALYESAPALTATAPALARLVATPPAPLRAPRLSLEVAYALVTFPLGHAVQNGVVVGGRLDYRRLEFGLGIAALEPLTATQADVTAVIHTVPIFLAAGWHFRGRRVDGSLDALGELLVVVVDPRSAAGPVRSIRSVEPALGAEATIRVLLGSIVRLYVRPSLLGILAGDRYVANGAPLVDLSRLQVGVEAGLTVALW
jgi:hypothetical protein